ncbi:MAG TPA: redoxin family protein [Gemmatales bacterium]|nr:redoxin family protein [Gemmatales bacterium]HMP58198.1 redoxin family protein [Gemmatales bacterium]
MMRCGLALVLAALLAAPVAAQEKTLTLGDAAPKMVFSQFVKGEPVKEFNKGTVYVLEFWATWCGPCIAAIPHVTELQKKYPKVVFIGVNVWEDDPEKVKKFVEKMGEKMEYRVAIDEGGDQGTMSRTWLRAAGQSGIPCSMIINGEGVVAWIGHPMQMDKPLDQIVAGTWDIKTAVEEARKEREAARKMDELRNRFRTAMAKGPAEAIKVIDEVIEGDPAMEKQLAMAKFRLLDQINKPDQTAAYAERIIDTLFPDEPMALNNISWTLIDPERPTEVDASLKKLALKAAQKADQLTESKDAPIADTLARAYFVNGDVDKAIEVQERAVKLGAGTEHEKEFKDRLEEYKKAKK